MIKLNFFYFDFDFRRKEIGKKSRAMYNMADFLSREPSLKVKNIAKKNSSSLDTTISSLPLSSSSSSSSSSVHSDDVIVEDKRKKNRGRPKGTSNIQNLKVQKSSLPSKGRSKVPLEERNNEEEEWQEEKESRPIKSPVKKGYKLELIGVEEEEEKEEEEEIWEDYDPAAFGLDYDPAADGFVDENNGYKNDVIDLNENDSDLLGRRSEKIALQTEEEKKEKKRIYMRNYAAKNKLKKASKEMDFDEDKEGDSDGADDHEEQSKSAKTQIRKKPTQSSFARAKQEEISEGLKIQPPQKRINSEGSSSSGSIKTEGDVDVDVDDDSDDQLHDLSESDGDSDIHSGYDEENFDDEITVTVPNDGKRPSGPRAKSVEDKILNKEISLGRKLTAEEFEHEIDLSKKRLAINARIRERRSSREVHDSGFAKNKVADDRYICIFIYIHICIYVYAYIFLFVYARNYMYVYVYLYMYPYICL
jgi:hypothetical protein